MKGSGNRPCLSLAGRSRCWALAGILAAAMAGGCGQSPELEAGERPGAPDDADLDGLCDATETELGTDPDQLDSDSDGLPDGLELALGYNPRDPTSPTPEQRVGPLHPNGSRLELMIDLSATGQGNSMRGAMIPLPSPYQVGYDAASLLAGAAAVEAQPPDNVRSVAGPAQRFLTVVGPTLLRFQVTFELPASAVDNGPDCASAHPFGYGVYDDSGAELSRRFYTLVVSPGGAPTEAEDFCAPSTCF